MDLAAAVHDAETSLSSIRHLKKRFRKAIGAVEPTEKDVKSTYELLEPIIENMETLASIIQDIGDVRHPFSVAWRMAMLNCMSDPSILQDCDLGCAPSAQGMPSPVAVLLCLLIDMCSL